MQIPRIYKDTIIFKFQMFKIQYIVILLVTQYYLWFLKLILK